MLFNGAENLLCFPVNVSIVHSPKLTVITDGKHQTGGSFTHDETIHFGSLEFIANCFSTLSLSDEGNGSGAVFGGIAHSGSPSLLPILEDSTDEGDTASSGGISSSFPVSRECNLVTPFAPITTATPSEATPTPFAITIISLWIVGLHLDPRLTPEQQQVYQEEQQV
jgi:hypothetical protein